MPLIFSKLPCVKHQFLLFQILRKISSYTLTLLALELVMFFCKKIHLVKHRVLAYASRLLNKAEQNYDVTKHESLSVIWAICHLGYKIHVHTDHYAVTESFTGQFAHWHLTIQEFDPTISYIPGKANSVADALSCNVATISVMTENPAMPTMDEIRKRLLS